jgi:Holliday junction DNA helicase RuvB
LNVQPRGKGAQNGLVNVQQPKDDARGGPQEPGPAADHVFHAGALAGSTSGSSGEPAPERITEVGLRPGTLSEFVGQRGIVANLNVHLGAAKGRSEPPDHVLFCGPPGLGKTSLARILSEELGSELHATSGPALDKPRDLVGLLTSLKRGDVMFIDEIHRLPISVEEYLYTAMEDFRVEMTIDSGPHARVLPITVEPFTLVGATTREGLLSAPFRARFGLIERLDPYPASDLVTILHRAAGILGIGLEDDAAQLLGERSRGTPRIAGRFLKRARDRAQVTGVDTITVELAMTTLKSIGVDSSGLEEMDRRILRCLAQHFPKPAALKTIAAVVSETEDTIEDVFEPHLLRSGFVQKTPRGRIISPAGFRVMGLEPPEATDPAQKLPFA